MVLHSDGRCRSNPEIRLRTHERYIGATGTFSILTHHEEGPDLLFLKGLHASVVTSPTPTSATLPECWTPA